MFLLSYVARTHNGVIRGPEKHVVTAPVLMWVKALDILLDQLRVEGADFGKLAALSGTGQVNFDNLVTIPIKG